MKLKSSLFFIAIFLTVNLTAEVLELSIRYLGIGVVNVTIMDNGVDCLQVTAKATSIATIASKMDNFYNSIYFDNYLPRQYRKRIVQKDYQEDRIVDYNRENLTAKRISFIDSTRNDIYPIHSESRDFFSALFSLRNVDNYQGELWLDAGKSIWKGRYKQIDSAKIKTILGKVKTKVLEIDFEKISSNKQERSDMLTNNLVDEDKKLYLWITDDQLAIPIKAKFEMAPFSVVWKLVGYEK